MGNVLPTTIKSHDSDWEAMIPDCDTETCGELTLDC
jgi:hypothetical protein